MKKYLKYKKKYLDLQMSTGGSHSNNDLFITIEDFSGNTIIKFISKTCSPLVYSIIISIN